MFPNLENDHKFRFFIEFQKMFQNFKKMFMNIENILVFKKSSSNFRNVNEF